MSPERMTQQDKLLQRAIDTGQQAMELSAKNAEAIAGLIEFASSSKERLQRLDEESDQDTERGITCRLEVEKMISTLSEKVADLRARLNYVLGGIGALGLVWGILLGLFLKHLIT
jgi:hypothetical protein